MRFRISVGSAFRRYVAIVSPPATCSRQLLRVGLPDADVQAGFGLALVPESSVRDELRQGVLEALDIPSMRTAIPITAIRRRNGYLSPAATSLLELARRASAGP